MSSSGVLGRSPPWMSRSDFKLLSAQQRLSTVIFANDAFCQHASSWIARSPACLLACSFPSFLPSFPLSFFPPIVPWSRSFSSRNDIRGANQTKQSSKHPSKRPNSLGQNFDSSLLNILGEKPANSRQEGRKDEFYISST